jgi:Ca2+-transporting ATPase
MTQVWHRPDTKELLVASKGAPEAIAGLCGLAELEISALRRAVDAMAADGLRVLGVAAATQKDSIVPASQTEFAFRLLGLVGLADPLRRGVPEAVRDCRSAGIRVVMITGDYPATAQAIARQAGIEKSDVLTGDELRTLDDTALAMIAGKVNVRASCRSRSCGSFRR